MQKCRHVLLTEVYRDIPYLFFVAEATTEAVVFEGDEKRVLPLTPAAIKKITLIRHPENSTYGGFSFLLRNEEYTVYPLSLTPVFQL